jgi:hypothetical protein
MNYNVSTQDGQKQRVVLNVLNMPLSGFSMKIRSISLSLFLRGTRFKTRGGCSAHSTYLWPTLSLHCQHNVLGRAQPQGADKRIKDERGIHSHRNETTSGKTEKLCFEAFTASRRDEHPVRDATARPSGPSVLAFYGALVAAGRVFSSRTGVGPSKASWRVLRGRSAAGEKRRPQSLFACIPLASRRRWVGQSMSYPIGGTDSGHRYGVIPHASHNRSWAKRRRVSSLACAQPLRGLAHVFAEHARARPKVFVSQ